MTLIILNYWQPFTMKHNLMFLIFILYWTLLYYLRWYKVQTQQLEHDSLFTSHTIISDFLKVSFDFVTFSLFQEGVIRILLIFPKAVPSSPGAYMTYSADSLSIYNLFKESSCCLWPSTVAFNESVLISS